MNYTCFQLFISLIPYQGFVCICFLVYSGKLILLDVIAFDHLKVSNEEISNVTLQRIVSMQNVSVHIC